jgi:hypothetical protein
MQVLAAFLGLSALAQAAALQASAGLADIRAPAIATAAPVTATPGVVRLPAGTQLEVELVDPLSSATSKLGDRFALRLAAPIVHDGVELAPAGAMGEGEVIDAARAGMNGKQGKLIISARHLELAGRQIRIRGMSLMAAGKSRVDLATGVMLVPYVGLASILIEGGEIQMPAGVRGTVRLAEDVDFPAGGPPAIPGGTTP